MDDKKLYKFETFWYIQAEDEDKAIEKFQELIDERNVWATEDVSAWSVRKTTREEYEKDLP